MELFKILGRIGIENDEANKKIKESTEKAKKVSKGFDDADKSARNLSKGGFTVLKGAAANLASQGFQRLITAVGQFVSSGVDYQKQIEQYQTSFAVMTGSQERAIEMTEELAEIAAKTPFELNHLADATQLLVNYGISSDEAIKKMTMLGDISQGSSDKLHRISVAYGQMTSAGKVLLVDVKQMIEAGFNPLQEISETTGESMDSLYDRISKGTISVDEITAAMERSTSEGGKYFGSMDAQSETLSGRLATLRDAAMMAFGDVFGGVLQKAADEWLPNATEKIENFSSKTQTIKDVLEDFKIKMEKVGMYAERHLSPIIDGVSTAFETVNGWVANATEEFSEWITSGEAANDIAELLRDAIELVADAYEAVTTGIQTTRDWLIEHETAAQMAAIAFGTLTTAIGAFTIAQAISKAGGVIYLAELAATAIGVGALTVAETVATVATTAFGTAMAFVTSPVTLVIAAIGALIAIIVLCVKHWDEIKAFAIETAEKISEEWQKFIDNMTTWFTTFWSKVISIWESIKSGIKGKVDEIVSNVVGKFTEIKDNVTGKIEELYSNVTGKFEDIRSKIQEKIESARDTVEEAIEKIKGFFNFEWNLPDIKLPHFEKTGETDIGLPIIGVKWYAKGGVMEEPTIFGMNGNQLMGGGEAGPEAVAPIDVLQGYVAEAVARQNDGLVYILERILDAIITMDENMGGNMREALDGTAFKINNREFGRLVRTVV